MRSIHANRGLQQGEATSRRQWLGASAILILAMTLLALGLPRTMAAWAAAQAWPALGQVFWGRTPRPDDTIAGIAALKRSIAWVRSGRRLDDLATLELERAWSLPAGSSGRAAMSSRAEGHFVEGLALDPAGGAAWLRLAWVRELLQRPRRSVAECLVQSLLVAPNLRPLWPGRARMLLAYWNAMTVDEVLVARQQLRTIWMEMPAWRTEVVKDAGAVGQLAVLQWMLGDDPAIQAEFSKIRAETLGR